MIGRKPETPRPVIASAAWRSSRTEELRMTQKDAGFVGSLAGATQAAADAIAARYGAVPIAPVWQALAVTVRR